MGHIYVVIPSLNPDEKLCRTVDEIRRAGLSHIVIVNDGSDREHLPFFPAEQEGLKVLNHRYNRGKGAALKTAFHYLDRFCPDCDAVVTADGDGQHDAKDIMRCAEAALAHPDTLVLGCRDFSGEDVPKRSRIGNRFTSGVFRFLCGMKISDTQTGLRAFSASLLPFLGTVQGNRFEYETNMLLQCKQHRIPLHEVKIQTVYLEDNASSHFHPVRDSLRVYGFIVKFLLSSGVSFLVDIGLFYLLSVLLRSALGNYLTPIVATVGARTVSSLLNYRINRDKVFAYRGGRGTMGRYYLLAIPLMGCSAGAVSLLTHFLGVGSFFSTLLKIVVDTVLFLLSYRIQQTFVFADPKRSMDGAGAKRPLTAGCVVRRLFLVIGTLLLAVVVTVSSACLMICYGPSESLRDMLVISAKQASATKWIPSLFLSAKTIDAIMEASAAVQTDVVNLDDIEKQEEGEWDDAIDGMKLIFRQHPNFKAYILLIRDPARVKVGISSENFANATYGKSLFRMADKYDCVAAINGGEFQDPGGQGSGARPMGLTYAFGKCAWSDGLRRTFIGFDKDNHFICRESMTKQEADALGVRDAVSFQNGNVLIQQDGEEVKVFRSDKNTGTAQRTAIGQRADGTVIFLVTDGRSADSIGATRNDVIDMLLEYGAVNAGMLDGGSSAMMYYENYYNLYPVDQSRLDEYQKKGLVNRYKAFVSPRMLPTCFIVTKEETT